MDLRVFSFLLLVYSVCFCRYESNDIIDPQKFPQDSFPSSRNIGDYTVNGKILPSYVYDPEGYIKPVTYKLINYKLAQLRKDTDVEVAIIIIDRLKLRENPYDFTKKVFDRFGVGDKHDNNGVVLSLIIEDRKLEFVHGKGMNNFLRNSKYDEIIENMKDFLRNNNVDEAVKLAVDSIIYQVEHPPTFFFRVIYFIQDHIILDIIFIIGLIFLCSFIANKIGERRMRQRERQYRAEMDGIRQHLQNSQTSSKPIFSPICAICMERFSDEHIKRNEAYGRIMEKRRLEELHPDVPSGIEDEPIDWSIDTGVETFAKCGHQFHRSCIQSWLQTSNTCPICRVAKPRELPKERGDEQNRRGGGGGGAEDRHDSGCSSSSSSSSSSFFGWNNQPRYYNPAPLTIGDVGLMMGRDAFYTYYNPFSYYNQWRYVRNISRTLAHVAMESSSYNSRSSGSHYGGGSSSGGGHRGGSW